MSKIFISYSHKDKEFTNRLYHKLLDYNIQCFFDENIEPGEDWLYVLTQKICESQVFIMVMTDTYFQSDMCQKEYRLAIPRHPHDLRVIPILLNPCTNIDPIVTFFQYADFTQPDSFEMKCQELCTLITGERSYQSNKDYTNLTSNLDRKDYSYLIDRDHQNDFFFETVSNTLNQDNKHAICIFHGNHNECLKEFFLCLEKHQWYDYMTGQEKGAGLLVKAIKWPEPNDDRKIKSIYQELASKVCKENKLCSHDIIHTQMTQSIQPTLIYSTICVDAHTKDHSTYINKINDFITFWKEWPVIHTRSIFIVCLLVLYKQPRKRKRFFFKSRTLKPIKDTIIMHIKDNFDTYLAKEMTSISYQDTLDWIDLMVHDFGFGRHQDFQPVINTLYEQNQTLPMSTLISELTPICLKIDQDFNERSL
jgi:hypothetical protein